MGFFLPSSPVILHLEAIFKNVTLAFNLSLDV